MNDDFPIGTLVREAGDLYTWRVCAPTPYTPPFHGVIALIRVNPDGTRYETHDAPIYSWSMAKELSYADPPLVALARMAE